MLSNSDYLNGVIYVKINDYLFTHKDSNLGEVFGGKKVSKALKCDFRRL